MCFNPKFAYYRYVFETPKGLKGIENARLTKKLCFTKKAEAEINTLRKDVLVIPCGKCLACRINHANNWATRCYLESKKWEHNYFVTLTIDEEHNTGTLSKRDIQLFLKKLRKHSQFRYFLCGEYGARTLRPH